VISTAGSPHQQESFRNGMESGLKKTEEKLNISRILN